MPITRSPGWKGQPIPAKRSSGCWPWFKNTTTPKCRNLLAELELRAGDSPETAVKEYAQALKLEPSNVPALNGMANLLANRQHKYDDAAFWAQKAVALMPDNPSVEDTLGWIFYQQGKYRDAMPLLTKSAKTFDRPAAHYHLAAVWAKLGDRERGRQEYNLAVKEDPKSAERQGVGPLFERR
jgi:Tfp pilus assembly protein PilF